MLCSWLPMQFGSPVSWEVALHQGHLKMLVVSSALPVPDCAKPGVSCPGGSSLLRAAVQLPSNHLDTSWWTKSVPIAHPAGPAGRRGLQEGDGPCRDEELLAPILGLIFVSLPFVLLLSGLQRMLYVRSSSPWQKPALKDWDYNKVVQLSVWTHPARSSQQFTTCINLSRIQGSRAFEFSMGNSHPFI